MGNHRRCCTGFPCSLHAAGWSVTCSSSSSSLGHLSLSGDASSKCMLKVSQSFGSVSADASLQPLSIAKQSPCFNGHVPPCSGRCDPSAGVFGLRRSVCGAPFAGTSADLRAGRSLSGSWSLNGRLWTKVCACIRSEQSSSVPCELSRCCTSGSCASVVSRPVSSVSSVSPVSVGGVGGSRVGLGVGVSRCGVEGGLACCLCDSDRKMGGGAGPGSTNSWSDTVHACGPSGVLCTKDGVSGPAEDLRPVSEVESGVNFRPAGGVRTGAGCRFTSQEATRHWNQASQGRCGHTFPPPGGSWYPIRVTWTRIGHQAINGLDEGV